MLAVATRKKGKTAQKLSLNPDVNLACFFVLLKPIKIYMDGMSQLSQITVMFVVNLKKSFKVIVEPEKTEQNKPDRQQY